MRLKPLLVAIIALAALAGCSKDSGSGPTTGPSARAANAGAAGAGAAGGGGSIDPCSLITTSEATAALGEPAKDGAPHSYQNTKQCQWDAADGSVAILVYIGGQKDRWPATHDLAKRSLPAKFRDVQGLGDAAFSNGIDLHILKGDDMYQIGVAGPFQDQVDRAVAVARQALARA